MSAELEAQLKALDSNALTALLLKRAGFDEDFQLWLELELAGLGAHETRQPIDPKLLNRRIEAVFEGSGSRRRSREDWVDATSDIETALDELLDQADAFLAAGDGHNALAILIPSGANLAEYYPQVAGWDETLHEFFPRLDRMIAQAVLLDGVSQEVRENLVDELGYWQDENGVYEDAFATAIGAATLGRDEPGLADVLAGRGPIWPLGESSEWEGDQLITARLAALEAMGSTNQFLNLARAARRHGDQAVMLAKRKRFDDALTVAHAELRDPGDILRLAETLMDQHQPDAAFDLAAWGLSLAIEKPRYSPLPGFGRHGLATWLRNQAQAANRLDLALMAARAAFEESCSRDDFRAAQTLSPPEQWPDLRATLLNSLIAANHAPDRIDILLDENLVDDAVAAVERKDHSFHSPHSPALLRLADAACATHPDWTIAFAARMATPIIEQGQSGYYDLAVRWLETAARAYAHADRTEEWRTFLAALIETHRRKHKLRALLEPLRISG